MLHRFEAFVSGISACHRYIQRIKAAEMTEFDLKGAHVMCLFYLHHSPEGLTAARLCELCGEDKAAISRTLAELTRRGYIAPDEGKKYRAPMRLTPEGEALAANVDSLICQWVGAGGDGLTEEEREIFYRVLGRIAENLRQKTLEFHQK